MDLSYLWKIGAIFITYIIIKPTNAHTLAFVRTARQEQSISLGPCTWVINRSCPDDDIKFYLFTRKNPEDRQLVHIDQTWQKSNLSSSYFDSFHPTKIIIHGYNSDMFLHPLIQMKDEYLQRGEYNLIFVDWSKLSPGPCYLSSVHNARHTGKCIAQLILRILDSGTPNIHLVGFSLGAQVTNFVAQNLTDFKIPRITGLDPAMPLFITASNENKLDASDAVFVDVFHTNAFVQGKIERCGHVDFYFNGGIIQPGCVTVGENPFACSHHRAPDYFAESIRSSSGFWGWACSSYISYLLGLCPPTNLLIQAGEDCSNDSRGMFLVTTNGVTPFAIGKWTDMYKKHTAIRFPISHRDPLSEQLDQWGKLEGNYNNVPNSIPFPQDIDGIDWTYFGIKGSNGNGNINIVEGEKTTVRIETSATTIPTTTATTPNPTINNTSKSPNQSNWFQNIFPTKRAKISEPESSITNDNIGEDTTREELQSLRKAFSSSQSDHRISFGRILSNPVVLLKN